MQNKMKFSNSLLKILLKIQVSILFLSFVFPARVDAADLQNNGWGFDKESKFQLGFFRMQEEEGKSSDGNAKVTFKNLHSRNLTPDGFPDGSIPLQLSLDRGFTLPFRGESKDLTYFLKFYEYPNWLNAHFSASSLSDAFLLNEMSRGDELSEFLKLPEDVLIKVGFIRPSLNDFKKNPLPTTFRIPEKSWQTGSLGFTPQNYLDSGLLYFTLYIEPSRSPRSDLSEVEKIKSSTTGLIAFKDELTQVYQSRFIEINGDDKQNRVFIRREPCDGNLTLSCRVSLYKIPREILFFPNARERPRLQGKKGSFSSGLLVVQRIEYVSPTDEKSLHDLDLKNVEKKWIRGETKIMELASTVQLPAI